MTTDPTFTPSGAKPKSQMGALILSVALLLLLIPAPASAEVSISCPYGDERSVADKLPRPGVVTTESHSWATYWDLWTVTSTNQLSSIYIDSLPLGVGPVVAVWENGTSCYGEDHSRNAWAASSEGRVYGESSLSGPAASHYGDMGGRRLNLPVVGMSATATGNGYWLVASDGGIFSFGDAAFHGSMGGSHLNKPIVGMSVTPSGGGYWLVASDGGIFSFGDAAFFGSMGAKPLNRPITGMTTTPSGHGYWMTADDGGIFSFGDAPFRGSMGGQSLSAPIAGMIPRGAGYSLIGQDGQVYPFG